MLLKFIGHCFEVLFSSHLLIVLAWVVERFVLLRYLPARAAGLQWVVAVVCVMAAARNAFVEAESATMEHAARIGGQILTLEDMGVALAWAAMLTLLDRVILWWRSRRLPRGQSHEDGVLQKAA